MRGYVAIIKLLSIVKVNKRADDISSRGGVNECLGLSYYLFSFYKVGILLASEGVGLLRM